MMHKTLYRLSFLILSLTLLPLSESLAQSAFSVENPAAQAATGAANLAAPRSQPGSVEERKEDGPVKSKIGALVLAGAALLPAAAQAGDPNPNVNAIVAQIASRRAEKDDASAKAIQASAQVEGRERAGAWSKAAAPGGGGGMVVRQRADSK